MLILGTLYAVIRAWNWKEYSDFDVFYLAGEKFWLQLVQGGVDFSVPIGETSPYRYSPALGWILIPFSWMPLPIARTIWCLIQWGFYAGTLVRLKKVFRLNETRFLILTLGTIRFAIDNSNIGQISALIAWLLVIAATSKGWRFALSLGTAVFIKVQPLALIGISFLRRQWADLGQVLLICAALLITSFSFGRGAFETWLSLLSRADTVLDPATLGNQSLYGVMLRLLGDTGSHAFMIVFGASALIALSIFRRSHWNKDIGWALGMGLLPVFGILTWKNTYLLWVFPLSYFVSKLPRASFVLAVLFLVPSQGFVGSNLNHTFLTYGVLPWTALIGALALTAQLVVKRAA